ncbi:hypothetical protein, partial [Priestia megaterium]|uniref:hypothetical protein n=1 Tax=Priestia megaterium TaxID=1404 RepID=UPI0035B5FB4E
DGIYRIFNQADSLTGFFMAYINKRKIGGLGVSIRGREQSPAIIAKQIQAILESVYDALDDVDASFGNINFYFSPYSGDGQKL